MMGLGNVERKGRRGSFIVKNGLIQLLKSMKSGRNSAERIIFHAINRNASSVSVIKFCVWWDLCLFYQEGCNFFTVRMRVCGLDFNAVWQQYIGMSDGEKNETRSPISDFDEIQQHDGKWIETASRYLIHLNRDSWGFTVSISEPTWHNCSNWNTSI